MSKKRIYRIVKHCEQYDAQKKFWIFPIWVPIGDYYHDTIGDARDSILDYERSGVKLKKKVVEYISYE